MVLQIEPVSTAWEFLIKQYPTELIYKVIIVTFWRKLKIFWKIKNKIQQWILV